MKKLFQARVKVWADASLKAPRCFCSAVANWNETKPKLSRCGSPMRRCSFAVQCRRLRRTCCRSTKSIDSHLRLPNYSPQNSVSACLIQYPGERARRFPRREARTRLTQTGSKSHEEQTSSHRHAILAVRRNAERCQCEPNLQPLAKNGQARRAKGAICSGLLWAAGRRPIRSLVADGLHVSRWAQDWHLGVQVMR